MPARVKQGTYGLSKVRNMFRGVNFLPEKPDNVDDGDVHPIVVSVGEGVKLIFEMKVVSEHRPVFSGSFQTEVFRQVRQSKECVREGQ